MAVAPPLTLEARSYRDAEVRRLVEAVQQEYVQRYGGPDDAHVEPDEFDPPNGLFLVGCLDGRAVATGGWRRLEPGGTVAELKRMYVVPRARRRGVARVVLAELERTAAEHGVAELVLNTGLEQPEAVALYESSGYGPVAGFGIYATAPKALFYGKRLAAAAAS